MYIWSVKGGGGSSGVRDPKLKKKSKMIQNCFFEKQRTQ